MIIYIYEISMNLIEMNVYDKNMMKTKKFTNDISHQTNKFKEHIQYRD